MREKKLLSMNHPSLGENKWIWKVRKTIVPSFIGNSVHICAQSICTLSARSTLNHNRIQLHMFRHILINHFARHWYHTYIYNRSVLLRSFHSCFCKFWSIAISYYIMKEDSVSLVKKYEKKWYAFHHKYSVAVLNIWCFFCEILARIAE